MTFNNRYNIGFYFWTVTSGILALFSLMTLPFFVSGLAATELSSLLQNYFDSREFNLTKWQLGGRVSLALLTFAISVAMIFTPIAVFVKQVVA